MANLTLMPRSRSRAVSSATGYWAWATAIPYPGATTTERAPVSIFATSEVVTSRCSPISPLSATGASPKPPRITETKERFMARHMM